MPLRRFQPISRAAQWSETIRFTDLRLPDVQSLDGVTLTLALYQGRGGDRLDYGRPVGGCGQPVVQAATQGDGSGPFMILPDLLSAKWTFPSSALACLCPGPAHLIVWATIGGETDEALRDTLTVLDGPRTMALPAPVVPPTPVDPNAGITVIVDGGDR